MKEHADNDRQTELAALPRGLDKLEAEHRELQGKASRRPVVPRKFLLTAAVAMVLVLATVGGLLGQQAKSLFIDPKGNVGIGTTNPINQLSVGAGFYSDAGFQTVFWNDASKTGIGFNYTGRQAVGHYPVRETHRAAF
jgi:hypothetical protein